MHHLINWIEIPVIDMKRAILFYSTIFNGILFQEIQLGAVQYALFPSEDMYNNGALVKGNELWHNPGTDGPLIYLNGGDDLNNVLSKVAQAGGSIIMEKTLAAPEIGYIGIFIDSEGNRIALHNPAKEQWERRQG